MEQALDRHRQPQWQCNRCRRQYRRWRSDWSHGDRAGVAAHLGRLAQRVGRVAHAQRAGARVAQRRRRTIGVVRAPDGLGLAGVGQAFALEQVTLIVAVAHEMQTADLQKQHLWGKMASAFHAFQSSELTSHFCNRKPPTGEHQIGEGKQREQLRGVLVLIHFGTTVHFIITLHAFLASTMS